MESHFEGNPEAEIARLELEARSSLPLADEEILELYRAAQGQTASPDLERAVLCQDGFRQAQAVDAVIIVSALCLLGLTAFGRAMVLWQAVWLWALLVVVCCVLLGRRASKGPIGPFSALAWIGSKVRRLPMTAEVSASDPAVLRAVVHYLTVTPIQKADELCEQIAYQRASVSLSLSELRNVLSTLSEEAEGATDDSMRLVIESKRDAARRYIQRLRAIDAELARQAEQAGWAVRPLRELSERFDRLNRVSDSLTRIQEAHGIIDEAEQALDENRIQLQVLQSVSSRAANRLREIEQVVNASEAAKAELDA